MSRSKLGGVSLVLLAVGLAACTGPDPTAAPTGPDRSAEWDDAVTYAAFVATDTSNHTLWQENTHFGAPADLVARARGLAGEWRLLVLAENWCSDAVFSVPFLAALADSVPGLELRLLRVAGREALFTGHERDGQGRHPLVLVLDEHGRERGGWVERPAELAAWIEARRGTVSDDDIRLYRRGWYEGNRGRGAMTEVLDLLAAAADGRAPTAVSPALVSSDREVTPCPSPD